MAAVVEESKNAWRSSLILLKDLKNRFRFQTYFDVHNNSDKPHSPEWIGSLRVLGSLKDDDVVEVRLVSAVSGKKKHAEGKLAHMMVSDAKFNERLKDWKGSSKSQETKWPGSDRERAEALSRVPS